MHQRDVVGAAEQRHHALGFAEAEQPVVDKDAGQLVADRLVDQHRRHRRIDAAGEAADHFLPADLGADFLDRLLLEGAHGPVAMTPGDFAHEVAQDGGAMRGVYHFKMKLHGIEAPRIVADGGHRRVRRNAEHLEARRQRGDTVAVAHPHRIFLAFLPDAFENRAVGNQFDLGAAEFAMMTGLDRAAELLGHGLFAVADAEHRHARVVNLLRGERGIRIVHRGRTAGEDHPLRPHGGKGFGRLLIGHNLGIDAFLADAAGDQLRHLRAEIDDQDFFVQRGGHDNGLRRGRVPWQHDKHSNHSSIAQPVRTTEIAVRQLTTRHSIEARLP